MRVLLDEQLPRQLTRHLIGHEVRTVQQQTWAGFNNGVLLAAAEAAGFNVFVTGDRNLEHQQKLTSRRLGVIVVFAPSNALEDLIPLVPEVLAAITRVQPGQVLRVPGTDSAR